jgi:hypothetical protein
MGAVVLVYAFEPLPELDGRSGVIALDAADADTLVAALRVERIEPHCNEAMRYVEGSDANRAARDALHAAHRQAAARARRATRQEA